MAQCESSGNWQAYTGNCYYGGPQSSRSTGPGIDRTDADRPGP
ncbi:transglycosylase family protein [Streptomyces sp. NPDC006990]